MRKVILFNMVTLDGYFEGPNREIDWHVVDGEFNEFANAQLDGVDTLLFGRVTYELMAAYWPTPAAAANDPITAGKMNRTSKVVFSKTLASAAWQNTRLVRGNAPDEVQKIKKEPGRDLIVFGSSDLAITLVQHGLIDEFRLMVNPVILGDGKSMFRGLLERQSLKLLKTREFRSGNVLLTYQPADPGS